MNESQIDTKTASQTGDDPVEVYDGLNKWPDWLRWIMGVVGAVVGAFLISLAVGDKEVNVDDPAIEFFHRIPTDRRISPSEGVRRLATGEIPKYAIRIVPATSHSRLDQTLGRDGRAVVFLGDYEEVRGLSLSEACEQFGLWPSACSVTVFKVDPNGERLQVRPGSYRGALKIAEELGLYQWSAEHNIDGFDRHGLAGHAIDNWAVGDSLPAHESVFMKLPDEFWQQVSDFGKDWNGLGFTVHGGKQGEITVTGLDSVVSSTFEAQRVLRKYGARCFLAKNMR